MDKYEIIIYWSNEDQSFIAEVPELPGCMAHGDTHNIALTNIKTAKEFNDTVPIPQARRLVFA